MGGKGKGKQRAKTQWTQWSCHQCGSSEHLESVPGQSDVCYCWWCWDTWGSWSSKPLLSASSKPAGKGKPTHAGKGRGEGKAASSNFQAQSKGKAAGKGKSKGAGQSVEVIESCPEEALQQMANKADEVYKNLPRNGRQVWKALESCIQSTIRAGVVHFERALRAELEVQLGDFEMTRQAGSQWLVTVGDGRHPVVCHASVRSEVLGGKTTGLLKELKSAARVVKNTLLGDGASWLRELADDSSARQEFMDEVREHRENDDGGHGKGKGKGNISGDPHDEGSGERCSVCSKSLTQDRLGGKHLCRIIASFKCCSKWTSHAGRYNLEEARVMGQRCQRCGQEGVPSDVWQLAGEAPNANGDDEKPHRSELCESCDKYGNCRGAFFDPFQMSMAVETLTGEPARWQAHSGGHIWTTHVMNEIIVLQPHVHISTL